MMIVTALTTTKTTSGRGATTTADATTPPRRRGQRRHAIIVKRAFVGPIFGTRIMPAASPPSLCGPQRRRLEQAVEGQRQEEEQAAEEEARGSEWSVVNGGWLWQERAVDGATSD